MSMTDILILPKAGRYMNPANESDALPHPYGNMYENATGGAWIAPCIDTLNYVYCAAAWRTTGTSYAVYDAGGLVPSWKYSYNFNTNYESQGVITTIQFSIPPSGNVTVAATGKYVSGSLITNPIDILEDLYDYAESLGVSLPEKDLTAFAQAKYACSQKSYTCAGVMLSDQSVASWFSQILASFLGEWWLSGEDKIFVRVDTNLLNPEEAQGPIYERTTQRITGTQSLANLVNSCPVNYAMDLTNSDKRFKEGVNASYFMFDDGATTQDAESIAKYGERMPQSVIGLDWTRNATTARAIQARIVEKFAEPSWIYDVLENGFQHVHLEVGDFCLFNWEERFDEVGNPMRNQIAQILTEDIDMDNETIFWQLRDTRTFWPGNPDIYDGTCTAGDGRSFGGDR